ncbi:MAG TPA: YfbM family protein [Micromonosporaceae bacterium]
MNGEYVRLTPGQMSRAIDDPMWALDLVREIRAAEDGADLALTTARYLTTDKAWQAIAFLLERAQFPIDIVYGEGQFADDVDWGYGPPGYLTAEQVRAAAEALLAINFDIITSGVSRASLAQADVYPQIWDEPDSLDWVRACYEPLVAFFADAAMLGDALLVWLD